MKKLIFFMLLISSNLILKAQTPKQVITIPGTTFVYVGTLTKGDVSSNSQKIIIKIMGGSWFADSDGESTYYISNRLGLNVRQVNLGFYSPNKLHLKAFQNGDKVDFYVIPNASEYTSFAITAYTYGNEVVPGYVPITVSTTSPAATEIPLNITPSLVTNENGYWGIGTATPQAKLSVNGNILASEIKVKTNINAPDYVFEPEYKLSSLTDVEAYIRANKHLPEVPSAATIAENGLDLAEMNLLLLKKVEELTLHAVDNEKKRQSLEEKLTKMEQLLHQLLNK